MIRYLSALALAVILSCVPKKEEVSMKTKYFGVHIKLDEVCEEELDLAQELGFNTIVLWDVFWEADRYDQVPSEKVQQEVLDDLANSIAFVKSYGFKVVVKIHTTPGEVGLVGPDKRYSWWMGFHLAKDNWFAGYWLNILKPIAEVAQSEEADALVIGNELYSVTKHTREWNWLIDSTRDIYKGKITYASFFTSPIVEDKIWLIKFARAIFGDYRLFRKIADSIGHGRFHFETKKREKEVAKAVLSHRNTWRMRTGIVGVNEYFPVQWYRKKPTIEGYEKAYTDAVLLKWGPIKLKLNYWKAVRNFAGNRPLWITEFWVSNNDPDWGEPGHAEDIFTAFMNFWWDRAEAIMLWEGPDYWKDFIETLWR